MTFQELGARLRTWLVRHAGRIGLMASAHVTKGIIQGFFFDYLLYGTVVGLSIQKWGLVWGSLVGFCLMAPLAGLYCYWVIRGYDWAKKDLFGLELLKRLREEEPTGGGFWSRFVRRIVRMGNIPAFLALSIYGDAIFVTLYFRRGVERYQGLSRRDWWIFGWSLILSNAWWTIRIAIIVEILLFLWQILWADSL